VKLPFTTNKEFVKYCKSADKVMLNLALARKKYQGIIPYAMIQTRMKNPRETKVVCLDGKVQYIAKNTSTIGRAISRPPHTELFAFVESAVQQLQEQREGAAITDMLVRVDVFKSQDGLFRVNEFESLEAAYQSTRSDMKGESHVQTFLTDYWLNVLTKCFERV
jgi:hypothetical protein